MDSKTCPVTMVAKFDENHTHICGMEKEHESPAHSCSDPNCRRYFWKKGTYV